MINEVKYKSLISGFRKLLEKQSFKEKSQDDFHTKFDFHILICSMMIKEMKMATGSSTDEALKNFMDHVKHEMLRTDN